MTSAAEASRSSRGFRVMKKRPLFSAKPPKPSAIATVATAGSACTILPSSSWCRFMSMKEMSCEASDVPVIRPMSCCREEAFSG